MTLPPLVTYDAHTAVWLLGEPFDSRPTSLIGSAIPIPQGFVTDLSSVPRVFWNLAAPFELSIAGALTHDWLYRHGGHVAVRRDGGGLGSLWFTRAQADQYFLDYMKVEGVVWWKRTLAHWCVRVAGGPSWRKAA
ncbi:MAG TPA: DUF1353 domain-containing protein [Vicinamibacterales bacterium]